MQYNVDPLDVFAKSTKMSTNIGKDPGEFNTSKNDVRSPTRLSTQIIVSRSEAQG